MNQPEQKEIMKQTEERKNYNKEEEDQLSNGTTTGRKQEKKNMSEGVKSRKGRR